MNNMNKKWYVVPPYEKLESWSILNEDGELVAEFEEKTECEKVVELWNKNI